MRAKITPATRTVYFCVIAVALAVLNIFVLMEAGRLAAMNDFFKAEEFTLCVAGSGADGIVGYLAITPSPDTVHTSVVRGALVLDSDISAHFRAQLGNATRACLVGIADLSSLDTKQLGDTMPPSVEPTLRCLVWKGEEGAGTLAKTAYKFAGSSVVWREFSFQRVLPRPYTETLDRRIVSKTPYALPSSVLLVETGKAPDHAWIQLLPCDWGITGYR